MVDLQTSRGRAGRWGGLVPLLILVVTLAADQTSKRMVDLNMHFGQSVPDEGFFRLTYVTNSGMAFGLFPGQAVLPALASMVGIVVLLAFYRTRAVSDPILKTSLGLQLGGAIGNLVDRVRLGYVIDFIDVGSWPVFNLADSAIVVGLTMLLFTLAMDGRKTPAPDIGEQPALARNVAGGGVGVGSEQEEYGVGEQSASSEGGEPWER